MRDGVDEAPEPTRAEIDGSRGAVVLEFGATWCGHCQALAPHLAAMLGDYPDVRHIWVEDGRGKPLGRSFRVKLWPTLFFLRDGEVLFQATRPRPEEVRAGLETLAGRGGPSTGETDSSRPAGGTTPP
jgi:thioredoxin 1